jgi:hypothetical protein
MMVDGCSSNPILASVGVSQAILLTFCSGVLSLTFSSGVFLSVRSKRVGLGEAMEEEKREKAAVKGKCLPRKKSFTSMKQARK